jgi:hypothetical protein
MDKTPEISALLALRDGELHDAAVSVEDPGVAQQLARMQAVRSELQSMPDVPISEEVWQRVTSVPAKRTGKGKGPGKGSGQGRGGPGPSHWMRYPLATAASVFFASLLGIYLVFSGQQQSLDAGQTQMANTDLEFQQGGLQLASLMNRSRQLELRLQGVTPLTPAADTHTAPRAAVAPPTVIERQLMGRLADVDEQIARMYEAGIQDPAQRERLWAQRVSLLESLVAVRGDQMSNLFEEGRSM